MIRFKRILLVDFFFFFYRRTRSKEVIELQIGGFYIGTRLIQLQAAVTSRKRAVSIWLSFFFFFREKRLHLLTNAFYTARLQ